MPDAAHRSVRVLIASSAAGTRTRLRSQLTSAAFEVVSEVAIPDPEDIAAASPDVVVVVADADAVRAWHTSRAPSLHAALVVSTDDEASFGLAADLSEAWGIVPSHASAGELRAAIDAVLHGHVVLPAAMAARLAASLSSAPGASLEVADSSPDGPVAGGEDDDVMVEPLTAREREVLRWLGEGLSNRAIAERLGISEHTVKFHISSIYGKLGASSRLEAVVRGRRQGLISL